MKHLRRILCLLTVVLLLPGLALANSYGLSSGLWYTYVSSRDAYEYWGAHGELVKDDQHIVVMSQNFERPKGLLLLAARHQSGGGWAYHTPGCAALPERQETAPKITEADDGFTITWPERGWSLTFSWQDDGEKLLLTGVSFGSLTLRYAASSGVWRVFDGELELGLLWQGGEITAETLCFAGLPRSAEEVERMNALCAPLVNLTDFALQTDGSARKEPVYAAPSTSAYRGAKGKASVSLPEGVTVYGQARGFDLVGYDISLTKRRIGFIRHGLLNPVSMNGFEQPVVDLMNSALRRVDAMVLQDVDVTDDPYGEAGALCSVKAGNAVTVMARLDSFYAYVETKDDSGKAIWGFVPLRALSMKERTAEDIAAWLVGDWTFYAGGVGLGDTLTLRKDGTGDFDLPSGERVNLLWSVDGQHIASEDDCWGDLDFDFVYTIEGEQQRRYGLDCGTKALEGDWTDVFSLFYLDGSGGYRRVK